jgi:hypothetical protein
MIAFRHKKGDESQLEYCQTRLKASIHFVLYILLLFELFTDTW